MPRRAGREHTSTEDAGGSREGGGMRLTQGEVAAIKAAAAAIFKPGTVVRLFGSRVNDFLRGGDVDLHLEVDDGEQRVDKAAAFRWRLPPRLSERKLDLVFRVRGQALRPIDEAAYNEGIVL